jgi:hypothetical protein
VDIIFAGICCWVDAKAPNTGKTVIIPNALLGGTHRGSIIPPHSAFIHAKRNEVDSANWEVEWTGGDDNLLFMLDGDYITFDPTPGGGSIDIALLPHVKARVDRDPICSSADEIRPGFRDQPNPLHVLGLAELPADASVSCFSNDTGAVFAKLHMPSAPVTITATPFNGVGITRSLTVIDPDARVLIANVSMPEYLLGIGAPDDDHKYLVCEMFRPHSRAQLPTPIAPREVASAVMSTTLSVAEARANDMERVTLSTLKRASQKDMHDFLCTFAVGCSDSQWP